MGEPGLPARRGHRGSSTSQRPERSARVRRAGDDLRGARRRSSAGGRCSCSGSARSRSASRSTSPAATRGTSSRTATRVPATGSTSSTTSSSSSTTTAAGACARCRAASCPSGTREIVAELLATGIAGVDGHARRRRRASRLRSTVCRCSSGWRRSRGSTSASTGARRSRGRSTSASGRSRTRARSTSVRYEPGEPAPDAPEGMMDVLREMGAKFE